MRVFDPRAASRFYQKTRRRFDEPGESSELTFSCYRGYAFLSRDRTRLSFIEELEAARRRWSFDLWAYVLMPEHVHLLIHPHGPATEAGTIAGEIKSWWRDGRLPISKEAHRIGCANYGSRGDAAASALLAAGRRL